MLARIAGAKLRLRGAMPFLGTLSLFIDYVSSSDVATVATNGKVVKYDPAYLKQLTSEELDAVVAHQLLHAALRHPARCKGRDRMLWNAAADIVTNGIVANAGLQLPAGALRDARLEGYSVEEVYAVLEREMPEVRGWDDLEADDNAGVDWSGVMAQAKALHDMTGWGDLPAGLRREIGAASQAELPWRTLLWRHITTTRSDFSAYDRRFVHRGLFVETLETTSLSVAVAMDTSGSIHDDQLAAFLAELEAIQAVYKHVQLDLYYADAAIEGPFRIDSATRPPPTGGGGTSFVPFFERLQRDRCDVAVYLTDGYGEFPQTTPDFPVIWAVTAGGRQTEEFPFGRVTRLVDV